MKTFDALCNTPERREIRDAVRAICDRFNDDYWLEKDKAHAFPFEFAKAMADGGWLGIAMPEEYGGAGLGVTEAAIMMQEVAHSAGAFAACSTVHINIFGLHSIVKHGTDAQKKAWLPSIIDGSSRTCFGVTEPDAGLDTSKIKTKAVLKGDRYIVNGKKIWTSTAQQADKIVLLARTIPIEECKKPTDGLTLFYTDFDRSKIEVREILKMGRHAVNSNQTFYDNYEVPVEHRIGEDGKGFRYILDSLNPEQRLAVLHGDGPWPRPGRSWRRLPCWCRNLPGCTIAVSRPRWSATSPTWASWWAPMPPSRPRTRRCARMAAWAMPRNSTSSAISVRPW